MPNDDATLTTDTTKTTDTTATTTDATKAAVTTTTDAAATTGGTIAGNTVDATKATGDQTIATSDAGDKIATDFPADWRTKMAGGDDKALKILERFASPKAMADALVDVRTKISKGELKAPAKALATDATPEQIAEWRTANDVPEAPEKYDAALPDGVVIGEADKPMLQSFQKAMHDANVPQPYFKAALGWWQAQQEANVERQTLADATFRKGAEDNLREQWGPEYRVNVTLYKEALAGLPEGMGDTLNTARDENGRLLGANPAFVSWLVNQRREENPLATVMAGSGVNGAQAMEAEMAAIRKQMGDDNSPYFKGPKITKNGRTETAVAWRYAELLEAEERMGKRAA